MYKLTGAAGMLPQDGKGREIDSACNSANLQNRIEMGFEKGFRAQIKNLSRHRLMSEIPHRGNKVFNLHSCY